MDKLNLGTHGPYGFCAACIARFESSAHAEAVELPNGRTLIHAFCEHRQAGALIVLRIGRPLRWLITVPIDVLEWHQLIDARIIALSSLSAATPDAGHANTPATAAQPPEILH